VARNFPGGKAPGERFGERSLGKIDAGLIAIALHRSVNTCLELRGRIVVALIVSHRRRCARAEPLRAASGLGELPRGLVGNLQHRHCRRIDPQLNEGLAEDHANLDSRS